MTEQIIRKRGEGTPDSHQNDNYVRHTDPAETARDFSRPHTIPKDEFEEATGRDHQAAIDEYEKNAFDRKRDEEARRAAA
jgi:hypothetical protein